jgi:multiple sugar transport system permease protein
MTTLTPVRTPRPVRGPAAPRRRGQGTAAYLLPAAVFLAVTSLYPLLQLVRMSVSDVDASTLAASWTFVGLENYRAGLESGQLQEALWRTVVFVVIVTVLGLAVGVGAAIAVRRAGRITGLLLGLMVFIWALPPVVNGSVWKFLFADRGLVNSIVTGLGGAEVPFLYDPDLALYSVAFVNAWAIVPFNMLVFRAAILNIDAEIFEAALLDGTTAWQEIRYVVLPALRPTALVLLVLTVVNAFRSFDFIYVMTKGGPGTATNTMPFLGYLQAFVQYDFGGGAATAVVTVVLVGVLAAVYGRTIVKEEKA